MAGPSGFELAHAEKFDRGGLAQKPCPDCNFFIVAWFGNRMVPDGRGDNDFGGFTVGSKYGGL